MSLLSLPADILHEVAGHVYEFDDGLHWPEAFAELEEYFRKKEAGILGSFGSLCLVHRQLRAACTPFMWKRLVIKNDHSESGCRDFLLQDILPQHGHLVENLVIVQYQSEISASLSGPDKDAERLNVDSDTDDHSGSFFDGDGSHSTASKEKQPFSPEQVSTVINYCPNVLFLELVAGEGTRVPKRRNLDNFMLSIRPSISKLKKVRKLAWSGGSGYALSGNALAKILDELPMLERLYCVEVAEYGKPDRCKLLGPSISRLQHLTELQFSEDAPLDTSISLQTWTVPLTRLSIVGSFLTADQAHQFIGHFASTLTELRLTRYVTHEAMDHTDDNPPYQLPLLTDLVLNCWADSFKECNNIRHLTWPGPYNADWASVHKLAADSAWPRIEKISMLGSHCYIPRLETELTEFCGKAGIELVVTDAN